MAFLDNSGDIILDAVLTDDGRRKMADGSFKISKFALSDEEINYALYNYNHPSGSAYYDLEILQTPILEAVTNTTLITGLLSLTNLNILYMPDLLQNQKLTVAVKRKNNTVYVATNSETYQKVNAEFGRGFCLRAGSRSGELAIVLESAINNSAVSYTVTNQNTYLISTNMLDTAQSVTFNTNLIRYPISAASTATWSTDTNGNWSGVLGTLQARTTVSPAQRDGFGTAIAPMTRATIWIPTGGATADITDDIQSAGVLGSMNALNIQIPPELKTTSGQTADPRWVKFGTVGTTPTGLTSTYSILPTSLEVTANTSGATIDIPITLIKYDS